MFQQTLATGILEFARRRSPSLEANAYDSHCRKGYLMTPYTFYSAEKIEGKFQR